MKPRKRKLNNPPSFKKGEKDVSNKNTRDRKNSKTSNTVSQNYSISEDIRINKFIAHAGLCSRREADVLIAEGKVEVNGLVVTELGLKVNQRDKIVVDGQT